MFKKGDLVKYWFDTGCRGYQYLYGVVIKSGPKTFTVQWESGIRNRRPQNCRQVLLVEKNRLADAREALGIPRGEQEEVYELGYMQGRGAS